VIAVEADPALTSECSARFAAQIECGKLTILNVAIAEEAGTATFWINEKRSALNSFNRNLTARDGEPHHSIAIPCRRLDQIIAEYGIPYYLKIDIEGNDLICCKQLSSRTKPEYISVEMTHEDLLSRLRDLGYDRFKLINQHTLEPIDDITLGARVRLFRWLYRMANYQIANRRLLLRVSRAMAAGFLQGANHFGIWGMHREFKSSLVPDWKFSAEGVGTYSGTFGADLPGKWLNYSQVSQIWNREMSEFRKMGKELCCDLHATGST
jgi:FkbM family methyltransferase